MRVYLTNLPPGTTGTELTALCAPFGAVAGVAVWQALDPARAGWVGVADLPAGSARAAAGLDGAAYQGQTLGAKVLRPWWKEADRPRRW